MEKFVLAFDPMNNDESSQFVIHLHDPKAIIHCAEEGTPLGREFRVYSYLDEDGSAENWTLSIHQIFDAGNTITDEQKTDLLDDAWDYFQSYLNWADEEAEDGDYEEED